jgi:Putative Flp pilus-assembly TadE/G-like
MAMPCFPRSSPRGQILVLFTLSIVVLLLATGLVVDGGYAFSQRRLAQNAADFAAMAGTRIVGEARTGQPAGAGTAANVRAAVSSVLAANQAQLVNAQYVDGSGAALGDVFGAGSIPANAFGVVVNAKTDWRPFFLGIVGVDNWTASTTATAITPGESVGGGVLPVGLQDSVYDHLTECPVDNLTPCVENLTSGVQNIPGGFAWLAFGIQGNGNKCDWTSLGMLADGGCQKDQPFLDSEIGPPGNSHGCCTAVGLSGSADIIGSLTGNEWGDLSFYIDHQIPVWVPIWDAAGGNGANAYYHIVGFGAIVFAGEGDQHAKWLTGAALSGAGCGGLGNAPVDGHDYCLAPGGAFTIGVTGDVRLIH